MVAYEPEAVDKHLSSPDLAGHVAALVDALDTATAFDEAQVEAAVAAPRPHADSRPAR